MSFLEDLSEAALQNLKQSYPGCEVKLVKLTLAEEAAQRLDGTFDPGKVLIDVKLPVRSVDFITIDFVIDPTVKKEAHGQDGGRAPIQHHVPGEVDEGR